ncbi:hypothetical protein [Mesorhizobium sp. GbtcB19]|uniref:hypothetical protein n=1 Tax=Mesorhizobium sp. GbtcB19 TaxID=2824764 RepID=UPI001C310127|nr:hypothetical protein [Mesorhizobium sp. GbtcB19]
MTVTTIYVYLPEEAVDCWYPAKARHLADDLYVILDEAPNDPVWEFVKGDIVRCKFQPLRTGVEPMVDKLVAFEKVISN